MPANPDQPAPDLDTVQRWFQAVVTHPDGVEAGVASNDAQQLVPLKRDELERMVTCSSRVSARDRLHIYANAYYARLLECVGESFPILRRALGEDTFSGFAFGYLQAYPSRSYTLGKLDDRFVEYLQQTRPDRDAAEATGEPDWPDFLIDLARLEWTINRVFDGPGVEHERILEAEDVQSIPPDAWPRAKLVPVPCLTLLTTRYPVNDYYTRARKAAADEPVEVPDPRDSFIAISRRDYIVRRYDLSAPQHALLAAIIDGATVGDAIAAAAEHIADDDALADSLQHWFRQWTAERFFRRVELG